MGSITLYIVKYVFATTGKVSPFISTEIEYVKVSSGGTLANEKFIVH